MKIKLEGKENFLDWQRALKIAAEIEDVWEILAGTEGIQNNRPDKQDFLQEAPPQSGARTRNSQNALVLLGNGDIDETVGNQTSWNMAQYQMAVQDWKENKAKVSMAKKILLQSVASHIQREILDLADVKEMYEHIEKHHGLDKEEMVEELKDKLEHTGLTFSITMTDWLAQLIMYQRELGKVGEDYSDSDMARLIIRHLPKSYGYFKMKYERRTDKDGKQVHDLDYLLRFLPNEEEIQQKKYHARDWSLRKGKYVTGRYRS